MSSDMIVHWQQKGLYYNYQGETVVFSRDLDLGSLLSSEIQDLEFRLDSGVIVETQNLISW